MNQNKTRVGTHRPGTGRFLDLWRKHAIASQLLLSSKFEDFFLSVGGIQIFASGKHKCAPERRIRLKDLQAFVLDEADQPRAFGNLIARWYDS